MSMPSSWYDGTTWAANASLISTRSMSSMLIPARPSACFDASTGPSPMISGESPVRPVATMRASGWTPSSAALVSDMTTTAAAPSLSGQQLPAGRTPSGRKTGCGGELRDGLVGDTGAGAVVDGDDGAVGRGDGRDLAGPEAVGDRLLGQVLRAHRELVDLLAVQAAEGGDVLGGLAHRDV